MVAPTIGLDMGHGTPLPPLTPHYHHHHQLPSFLPPASPPLPPPPFCSSIAHPVWGTGHLVMCYYCCCNILPVIVRKEHEIEARAEGRAEGRDRTGLVFSSSQVYPHSVNFSSSSEHFWSFVMSSYKLFCKQIFFLSLPR